jgi:hypothetical protein
MPTTLLRSQPAPRSALLLRAVVAACATCLVGSAFAATQKAPEKKEAHATAPAKAKAKPKSKAKATSKAEAKDTGQKPGPLADFGGTTASPEAMHVANWVSYTHNNGKKAFVVIDKKAARMYVFDANGKLKSHTPVLLGLAVGDDSAPGIGNMPLSKIPDNLKTTPAGRFLARPGKNSRGHDIIWIDYDAAVSMHRVLKVGNEHRFERLASPEIDDNRVSNGCVNVPIAFYDKVLRPTVLKQGAFVYVLPETRSPQKQFGSYDVPANGKEAPSDSGDKKAASS